MKNTILILSFLFSFAYAEDQKLLPPIEPDGFSHRYGVELDVMGLSYHTKNSYDFNEENPGLGVSFTIGTNVPDDGLSAVMVASVGYYKDSYNEQAKYFLAGPRGVIGHRDGFHVSGAIQVGYVSGSGLHGGAIIPFLSVGYDRFDLCITGDPIGQGDTEETSKFIACFLKIRVLDF
jgi:hypothetical protein